VALALAASACGASDPPESGGALLDDSACGRGLLVVGSDYQSTNLAVVDRSGQAVAPSLLSSGSAAVGLSAPLSGDVVLPTSPLRGPEIVAIDRYPSAVLTFVELASGRVRAQLDVGTGFAANPHDYLPLGGDRAYVSRFEANQAAGSEPFDGGSDLLIVEPSVPAVVGRVDLSSAAADAPGVLPRPHRMLRLGDFVVVLLSMLSGDFQGSSSARLALIDPASDELVEVFELTGLHGCSGLAHAAPAADGSSALAVTCSGRFSGGSDPDIATSGVALLRFAAGTLSEQARWTANELGGQPLGFSVTFADAQTLLVTLLGSLSTPATQDALVALDLSGGGHHWVARGEQQPFEMGDVQCMTPLADGADAADDACGACFLADGEQGRLQRFALSAGGSIADRLQWVDTRVVESAIGLPPRALGRL
jgi:hypothetical protein